MLHSIKLSTICTIFSSILFKKTSCCKAIQKFCAKKYLTKLKNKLFNLFLSYAFIEKKNYD